MNIEKILVAYDGSEESEKAFDMALDLAGKYSAQVVVVSVARPSEPPTVVEMDAILEVAAEYYHTRFSDLRKKASRCGVRAPVQNKRRPSRGADRVICKCREGPDDRDGTSGKGKLPAGLAVGVGSQARHELRALYGCRGPMNHSQDAWAQMSA